MLIIFSRGNYPLNLISFNSLKCYSYNTLSFPSQEIKFMISKATSSQRYGRLPILTPFFSSINSSLDKNMFFLATVLGIFSLFHLNHKGKVVILLISSGESVISRPLTTVMALSIECDFKFSEKSQYISSPKPFISSKKPSH